MGLFDFLGIGGGNPANAAKPYIDQIPGQLHQTYDPYINRGNDQYAGLNKQYTSMGQDPTGFLNAMMQSYTPSKSYQLQRDEAMRAAGNTAAAGGMRGSLDDITKQSRLADSLMGQDMQQWLSNAMGIQNQGLQGQQHFYDQGYGMAHDMGGDLANALGTQGQLAYQGRAQENQGISDLLGSLMKIGGAGAGAIAGGPLGSIFGEWLGSHFGGGGSNLGGGVGGKTLGVDTGVSKGFSDFSGGINGSDWMR